MSHPALPTPAAVQRGAAALGTALRLSTLLPREQEAVFGDTAGAERGRRGHVRPGLGGRGQLCAVRGHPAVVDRHLPARPGRPGRCAVTPRLTQFGGRAYMVDRTDGDQPDTVTEWWEEIGLIGSERRWLGDRYTKQVKWWATRNPSGEPGQATAYSAGFASQRAAVLWLIREGDTPPSID
jgi:hypothetical protein